jgi:hypothetical protein
MPRVGPLLALSRDHHGALVIGRDARRAAAGNDSAVWLETLARVEEHWRLSMAAHFAEEERLISIAKEKLDADAVARVLSEHAELRVLAAGPCPLEPRARLCRFGELVSAHVRYEERIFFPQLQPHV